MAKHAGARARKQASALSEAAMQRTLRATLPRRGNYCAINYSELLNECAHFGVRTRGQFRSMILRHRRKLIGLDHLPLDAVSERMFRNEWGDAVVTNLVRRQSWFSWEGSTRIALELEFGEAYEEFARHRVSGLGDR